MVRGLKGLKSIEMDASPLHALTRGKGNTAAQLVALAKVT